MIRMQRANGPASPEAISNLEMKVGGPLPTDYRRFLETTNGGRPEEYEFRLETWGSIPLNNLYGVGVAGRSDLLFQAERTRAQLPVGVIPIGDDPGGNYICLKVIGPSAGTVWLWDHEAVTEEEAIKKSALHLIAKSFDDFVSQLTPVES